MVTNPANIFVIKNLHFAAPVCGTIYDLIPLGVGTTERIKIKDSTEASYELTYNGKNGNHLLSSDKF